MVLVKRGGKFVKVKPGTSIGRSGGRPGLSVPKSSGGSSASKRKELRKQEIIQENREKFLEQQAKKAKAGKKIQIQREVLNKYLMDKTRARGRAYLQKQTTLLKQGKRTQVSKDILNKLITEDNKKRALARQRKLLGPKKQTPTKRLPTAQEAREQLAVVEAVKQPTSRAGKIIKKLEDLQKVRSTKSIRTQQKNLRNELELLGLTIGNTIIGGTKALVQLPSSAVTIAKDPKRLKNIPSAIKQSGEEFGQLIRISPTEALGKIGGEILFLKGSGEALKVVGKVGGKTATRLSLKFKGIRNNKLKLNVDGDNVVIRVGGSVKRISEPISKQANLAGKRVLAVSAQADKLIRIIRDRGTRIVRKPIPGETSFSPRIKLLLRNFDAGKITKKQLRELQNKVPVLERSFFADPRGRFRPSRLGTKQKEASLIDFLAGDFTFKTNKPQILVFNKVLVEKFPKALEDIEKALKSGKALTQSQTKRLLDFQIKKSGKFKPVGFLSKEPEITLAPGEVIKKVKKVGVTLVNGKRVEIIQAKVVKAKPTTTKLIKKAKSGKISSTELKTLRKNLKKETGFDSTLSRSSKIKPRARLPKRVPRVTKTSKKATPMKTTKRKTPVRKTRGSSVTRKTTIPIRTTSKVTRKSPPRKSPPRKSPPRKTPVPKVPPRTGMPGTPRKVIRATPRIKSSKVKKSTKKEQQVFNVYGKSGGKFIKLNKKPLVRNDALSKGTFAVDRTTAKTFKIEPAGKTKSPGKLLKSERNYYGRQGFKLREVKIKKGRKFQLKNKFIEKGKYGIDTKSEKAGLTIAKLVKQQRGTKRKTKSKRKKR